MNGAELARTPGMGIAERWYIRLFGAPINGLRIRIRRIMPEITSAPAAILDAGCGRAVFSYLLAKKFPGAKVLGVDTDTQQLRINEAVASSARLGNLRFARQDVAALPYDREFDMVLSVDNIEHVEDDQRALESLAKALKPGGRLYLHVPAYERRWFFFTYRTNFDVPGHFRPGYTLAEIRAKIEATGLQIVKAYYTYGWLENVSNNISYWITRAEAKNKVAYALLFPLLNCMAWLGRNSRPRKGAGVLVIAEKKGR